MTPDTNLVDCGNVQDVLRFVFQGKWRLAVLKELLSHPVRLSGLLRALPGCSKKVLLEALHDFQTAGWTERVEFAGRQLRVEYGLHPTCHEKLRRALEPLLSPELHAETGGLTTCQTSDSRPARHTIDNSALLAHQSIPGSFQECSLNAAWRNVLLRRYLHPASAEPYETLVTNSQLIVLVKSGSTHIRSFSAGRWRRGNHLPGNLGYIPANETARLRWHGSQQHTTLQLHLPQSLLFDAADDLAIKLSNISDRLNALTSREPLVQRVILDLENASGLSVPELYAESAAHFLAIHLLSDGFAPSRAEGKDTRRLRRIDDFLRAHVAKEVSLLDIAGAVDLSTFQLIRVTKEGCGETPFRRLTRFRVEHAKTLLASGSLSVASIAAQCGYSNSSHFALAFRRIVGEGPQQYRERLGGVIQPL